MNPRFFVNGYNGDLEAEMEGERDIMFTAGFMQRENKNKANEYLRKIASRLNKIFAAGDYDAGAALLQEAESKVKQAQTAESFLDKVDF